MKFLAKQIKTITILSLFFVPIFAYATNGENWYGKYQSINSEFKVSFILNEDEDLHLSINEIRIDSTTQTDFGMFFGTWVFRIEFEDNEKHNNVIELYLSRVGEKAIFATGYYMQYKIDDKDKITVIKKQALEFSYEKLEE